jgi:hypothetical protein
MLAEVVETRLVLVVALAEQVDPAVVETQLHLPQVLVAPMD